MKKTLGRVIVGTLAVLVSASAARAQATRTWVSGVGDDANPCSRTAPCKTFAGAISKTASGGEIDALDPGGYGAVTITKSITLDGNGTLASILASGTQGIIINNINFPTVPAIVVTLRNLTINGAGGTTAPFVSGINGIRILNGVGAVHIENCIIQNFTAQGVDAQPNLVNTKLFIKDTIIHNVTGSAASSSGAAVLLKPVTTGGGTINASFSNVRLEQNQVGLRVEDNAAVALDGSVISGNFNNGVVSASALALPVNVSITRSLISGNDGSGVRSTGSTSTVRLAETTITRNQTGLSVLSSGNIISFKNNFNNGNTVGDGSPTLSIDPN